MYSLDVENREELSEILAKARQGEKVSLESINYSYDDLVGQKYKLVLNTDYYEKENGIWVNNLSIKII